MKILLEDLFWAPMALFVIVIGAVAYLIDLIINTMKDE